MSRSKSLDMFGKLFSEISIIHFPSFLAFYPIQFSDPGIIMERWHRGFLKNGVEFKELFGITKEIFLEMLPILTAACHERHRTGGGRPVVPYPSILAGVSDDGPLGLRF